MNPTVGLDRAIGRQLISLRIDGGLTQEQLASKSGLPVCRLDALESGSAAGTLVDLSDVADALELHLIDILLPVLAETYPPWTSGLDMPAWGLLLNRCSVGIHDQRSRSILIGCVKALSPGDDSSAA